MPHYSPHVGHWGNRFQSLPLSSPSSSPTAQNPSLHVVADAESDVSSGREGEQSCNNPTIFVGSLPTNMDEKELRFSLQVHLSQYAKVMYVKIHHGKDGGMCAFVQFENVDSASVFLDTLRANSQRLFLGRRLRFEIAHAHRTLLVSYRAPDMQNNASISSESLDLPFAMTIRKNASPLVVFNETASEEPPRGASGLHFQPVVCTAEVIHQLATHFGPFERLELYKQAYSDYGGVDSERTYPPPHDAPRLPTMDPRCWEIKFQSRSDCVTALNTLLTIPFITVTWAHHRTQQSDVLQNTVSGTYLRGEFHNDDQPGSHIKGDSSHSPNKGEGSFDWSTDAPGEGHIFSANRLNVEDDESTPRAVIAPLVPSKTQVQDIKNGLLNGVGVSPVLPNESDFPSTPSNTESLLGFPDWHNNNSRMGCGFEESYSPREFDKSALYIPNLLVHGPEAWTEYKLEDYFSAFGGVKDVKLVSPPNAPTGYAIVSFDNIESAAYAKNKQERFGRVQYRHINRGGRGRGRGGGRGGRSYLNNYRRYDGYRRDDRDPSATSHQFGGVQCVASDTLLPNIGALNVSADPDPPLDGSLSVEIDVSRETSGSPGQQKLESSRRLGSTEGDREGVDKSTPGALLSFQPSVPASSMPTIAGGQPYSMNTPYRFHHVPWGVPQMPQMPYGVPYYPGYHVVPSGPAGTPSDPPHYWPGMYGPFISHPAYPQRDNGDAGQPVYPSPPVPAIGHFQDEHRGLVPFYPQEALSQYMTQYSPDNQNPSSNEVGHQPCLSLVQAHAPSQHTVPWAHFAPMIPFPYQPFAPHQGQRPWAPAAPSAAGGPRRDASANYNKNGRSPLQNKYRGNGNMGESSLSGEWNCFSAN